MISASFKEEAIKSEDSPAQQAGSPQVSKFSIGLKKATSYKSSPPSNPPQSQTTKLEAVFSAETDEVEEKPKKMLVPIDYSDDEENAPYTKDRRLSTEDKKKMVQNLVNSIPSSKEEVFKYTLRWEQMDSVSWRHCMILLENLDNRAKILTVRLLLRVHCFNLLSCTL